MIGLVLICHGNLGAELLRTAEGIVGSIEDTRAISNIGIAPEVVTEHLRHAINSFENPSGILLMVDLFVSSCWRDAMTCAASMPTNSNVPVAVLSGMNLGTVLSFSQKRQTMPFRELVEAMVTDAQRGIVGPKFFGGDAS
jgi:PTS system mannose-specific IIA component